MTIQQLLNKTNNNPEVIEFNDVMQCIDSHYEFTETAFTNGEHSNAAGENNGSCKILYFAKMHNLNKVQTLNLFGQYYRHDVLNHPDSTDHQNIRQFMQYSFEKLRFSGVPLSEKK